MGIFRQKTVAGVNGLRSSQKGGADDLIFVQIAVGGFRAADAETLVSQRHMKGFPVCLGIHRHRGDAHFLAGPDNADSDLAPVGDEDF